jgi:hypothetical protein
MKKKVEDQLFIQRVRIVIIPACEQHEGIYNIRVNLYWICPICGGPRGEVVNSRSFDGSRQMFCHGWTNPCGHVDKYSDVRIEARNNGINDGGING